MLKPTKGVKEVVEEVRMQCKTERATGLMVLLLLSCVEWRRRRKEKRELKLLFPPLLLLIQGPTLLLLPYPREREFYVKV